VVSASQAVSWLQQSDLVQAIMLVSPGSGAQALLPVLPPVEPETVPPVPVLPTVPEAPLLAPPFELPEMLPLLEVPAAPEEPDAFALPLLPVVCVPLPAVVALDALLPELPASLGLEKQPKSASVEQQEMARARRFMKAPGGQGSGRLVGGRCRLQNAVRRNCRRAGWRSRISRMRRLVSAFVLLASLGPVLARADAPQAPPPPAPLAPPPPVPSNEPPPLYSPPAYEPNAQPIAPPTPPPQLGPGVVHLHLMGASGLLLKRDSGPPVMVFDEKGSHLVSGAVCVAPCDAIIDARSGTSFVFGGGDGIPDSASFDFAQRGGDVQARVEPGSKPLRLGAVLLGGLALGTGYLGVVFLGSAPGADTTSDRNLQTSGSLVLIGVAGAMAVGCGVLYLLSRTRYDLTDSAPQPGGR